MTLDAHPSLEYLVDEFCYELALILRRILDLDGGEEAEHDDDDI